MNKMPKWFMTTGLPAFNDGETATAMEMTYKLYQAMNNLIDEYNNFVDTYNTEWSQFVDKYNGDIEVFTLAMRQEFQDFIDTVDVKIQSMELEFNTDLANVNAELTKIKNILLSDDVNLDTLQELVNALKNNVSSINDIFTELSNKLDKNGTDALIINNTAGTKSITFSHDRMYYKSDGSVQSILYPSTAGTLATKDHVKANEELEGTEETLNSLTIDGNNYNVNKMKLVATGTPVEVSVDNEHVQVFKLDNTLKNNTFYYLEYNDVGAGIVKEFYVRTHENQYSLKTTPEFTTIESDYDSNVECYLELNDISFVTVEGITYNVISVSSSVKKPLYQDENSYIKVYELPFSL